MQSARVSAERRATACKDFPCYLDMFPPIEPEAAEDSFNDFLNAVGLAGGDDKIAGFSDAEDARHRLDVIGSVTPVHPC